ncbi:Oidioi.mRNA.OKI2018_I69.chr2.g5471.t1.cds [Oikopleura dioica]|uniref:Oidioi.mRNA.OKI2018_I69.chr2.g5471.t1.cds n=1 Tax=Oikopleura dioica TaxID=34765 RepID=A0ABN7SZZ4_OIKDI|nr:Oidioi.mRNA.OKI2018_I69.chr2.g5471.t1.cds [Oikopleura dioica]
MSIKHVAFGRGGDKRTFPSFVQPDRVGNENLLPVLYQDPKMGPGKYDIDRQTTFVSNFSPNILSPKGYIIGGRKSKRFEDQVESGVPPNFYFRRIHDEKVSRDSFLPFNSQKGPRFQKEKTVLGPTIGSYNVTEDFGRQVKHWRRAPASMKEKRRVPLNPTRSILIEEKEHKRYCRRLDYLSLYF